MAERLIWSPNALLDIEEIAEFISRDSVYYAESTVSKFFNSTQSLLQFPQMGRIVPEKNIENIRELFVFQYRIIYEIKGKEIYILAVIHGKTISKI